MLSVFAPYFAKHTWDGDGEIRTCTTCGCVEEITVGILSDDFYSPLKCGTPMLHFQKSVLAQNGAAAGAAPVGTDSAN